MTNKFSKLRKGMSPEAQARSHEKAKEMEHEIRLGQDGKNVLKIIAFLLFIFGYFIGYFSILIFSP
jgi:hypothetical protein